jgi:hypothetical protein
MFISYTEIFMPASFASNDMQRGLNLFTGLAEQ